MHLSIFFDAVLPYAHVSEQRERWHDALRELCLRPSQAARASMALRYRPITHQSSVVTVPLTLAVSARQSISQDRGGGLRPRPGWR